MVGACKPVGEIDVASAAAFDIELHDAIDSAREMLVDVDCSELTFMDLAGYHVLVAATQYAARRGHRLVIRNLSAACARLIELYDWERELNVATANDSSARDAPDADALPGDHNQS